MADSDSDKNEMPTPKRLEDARHDGNILFSPDVAGVLVLLGGAFLALYTFKASLVVTQDLFKMVGEVDCRHSWTFAQVAPGAKTAALISLQLVGWPLLGFVLLGLVGAWVQTGFYFNMGPFEKGFRELDLAQGVQRLMPSASTLTPLLMTMLNVTALGGLLYIYLVRALPDICLLPTLPLLAGVSLMAGHAVSMAIKIMLILGTIAALDYYLKRRQYYKALMMSREEIRDEMRNSEGDPQIKARIRQKMRQMLAGRLSQVVPKAQVVVCNPTHVAVALRYATGDQAPRVVAKGVRKRALRIKALAADAGIPIIENPPLARALYKDTPVGAYIDSEFFAAVAVVLASLQRAGLRLNSSRKSAA